MEGEMKNLIKVWLSILASLCYCYFIASKIPKGKLRLFSLLPIFFLYTILPLSLSLLFPIGITAFFFTWLANFKLLLFAFDQGPLSCHPQKSLVRFISIACLPIKIKQNEKYPSPKPPKLPLNWPTKVLLYAILVSVHDYKDHVHPKIMIVLYSCMVYLLIDIILGLCNAMVHAMLGIELESPSDEPYFSTSLQDFWSRRWNLMVTNLLRQTVYKPVRSSLDIMLGAKWAPLLAVLAVFLVSGLMHELLFYYVMRVSPTWEVTWFFVLHGVCVVVEFGVKRLLTDRWQLHWAVSGPLTVGFVIVTAMWLFFPPVMRTGAVVRAIEECKVLVDFVKGMPKLVRLVLVRL